MTCDDHVMRLAFIVLRFRFTLCLMNVTCRLVTFMSLTLTRLVFLKSSLFTSIIIVCFFLPPTPQPHISSTIICSMQDWSLLLVSTLLSSWTLFKLFTFISPLSFFIDAPRLFPSLLTWAFRWSKRLACLVCWFCPQFIAFYFWVHLSAVWLDWVHPFFSSCLLSLLCLSFKSIIFFCLISQFFNSNQISSYPVHSFLSYRNLAVWVMRLFSFEVNRWFYFVSQVFSWGQFINFNVGFEFHPIFFVIHFKFPLVPHFDDLFCDWHLIISFSIIQFTLIISTNLSLLYLHG